MKRTLSIILLTVSCLILIASIIFCFYSVYDINRTLNELANNSSASGIDYMGVGWGYGICLFITSTLGLILMGISKKRLQKRILQHISVAAMILFAFLVITSFVLFYM